MKLVTTSLLLAAGLAFGQAGAEKAVRTSLDQFAKAVVARDEATLNRLLADSVVYSHSNAKVDTKASFIGDVMHKTPIYESFTMGPQNVRIFGKTATVRGKITVKDIVDGKHRTIELNVLQVWVENPNGWQLVERHSMRLNP